MTENEISEIKSRILAIEAEIDSNKAAIEKMKKLQVIQQNAEGVNKVLSIHGIPQITAKQPV